MTDHYTYRITWSPEDGEHLGLSAEFPSSSWLASTPSAALSGIQALVSSVLADMQSNGEPPPEPRGRHGRTYTRRMAGGFKTDVLDRALARKRRESEALRLAVQARALRLLDESPVDLDKAILFGSVVRPGRFDPRSDVDIAVPDLEPRDFFALMGHLEAGLEREIDLVPIDHCHFADSIRRTGLTWNRTGT